MKKVAICVPSGDMVHADFACALAALTYRCGPGLKVDGIEHDPIGIALVNIKGSLVVTNRNNAVKEAKNLGVDYLFFVDSDIVLHPWTLRRLLSLDKDIVGATYVQREEPGMLLGKTVDGTMLAQAAHEMRITTAAPMEVGALPTGCLLIKMSVFDDLAQPYFQTPAHVTDGEPWIEGEDFFFCRTAREAGHKIYLDWATSFAIAHVGQKSNTITTTQAGTGEANAIVH
jgi:hypothetical protein